MSDLYAIPIILSSVSSHIGILENSNSSGKSLRKVLASKDFTTVLGVIIFPTVNLSRASRFLIILLSLPVNIFSRSPIVAILDISSRETVASSVFGENIAITYLDIQTIGYVI